LSFVALSCAVYLWSIAVAAAPAKSASARRAAPGSAPALTRHARGGSPGSPGDSTASSRAQLTGAGSRSRKYRAPANRGSAGPILQGGGGAGVRPSSSSGPTAWDDAYSSADGASYGARGYSDEEDYGSGISVPVLASFAPRTPPSTPGGYDSTGDDFANDIAEPVIHPRVAAIIADELMISSPSSADTGESPDPGHLFAARLQRNLDRRQRRASGRQRGRRSQSESPLASRDSTSASASSAVTAHEHASSHLSRSASFGTDAGGDDGVGGGGGSSSASSGDDAQNRPREVRLHMPRSGRQRHRARRLPPFPAAAVVATVGDPAAVPVPAPPGGFV
jgi:hypothetical protein